MLKVSDAFNSAFAAPDRELRARVTIGKTVYDSDDLTSINYDSGAMTGEQFSIGSTYMNSAKIIFSHLVEGLKQLDEVLVEFGVLKPDGTVEYVKMGTFIVDDKIQMDRNNNTTTIECMDRMTMLGGTYVSKLTYPARIKDVAIEIANMAGVKANEASFARLSENKINQPTGYTYRDAIGLIAQFQMGFALFDRDGLLDIRTLQDNSFKIDPNQYFLKGLVKNETFFKLNGISCTVVTTSKDENGNETSKTTVLQSGSSSGSQIKLANNVMTQDVLDRMYESLKFTNYYPFTLNWNGNPAVEAGDWLTLEDMQGNEFKVPNMSYTLTFNGGLTASSKAETSTNSSVTYSYGGSMSNIVNEIGGREGAEGNHIYEGTEDQKPLFPKEGDLWYKHVGPDTEEWIYKDGKWEFLTSTKTANDAADAADKASKEAEEAKTQANESVAAANDAVAKAGFANDTATQAKSDAAAAGQQAKDALTSAGTAITDAQKALTNSSSAQADSAQARKDSATAVADAVTAIAKANSTASEFGKVSQKADSALNSALDAQSDASMAVTQALSAAADSKDAKQIAGSVSQSYKTLTDGSTMTIAELESGLAAKLTKTDLDGYSTQTWTQNQIKMTADGINSTLSSVKTTVDGQTTSINDLKADSSSFKNQFTTVNDTLGKHTTDIGSLQASSKSLTTGFNTLTTDNTTNKNDISQLKQTATEVSSTLETVQTQVQDSSVGTNLLTNTADNGVGLVSIQGDNSGPQYLDPITRNDSYIEMKNPTASEMYYRFCNVDNSMHNLKPGQTYTIQGEVYVSKGTVHFRSQGQWNNGGWADYSGAGSGDLASDTSEFVKVKYTFTVPENATAFYLSWQVYNFDSSTVFRFRRMKLEVGANATDFSVNPLDNATVTAFSKLSQTVDGMKLDISKKIEKPDLNGYATQMWTQSQIKSTADQINLSVTKVQTNLDNMATTDWTKSQLDITDKKITAGITTVTNTLNNTIASATANMATTTWTNTQIDAAKIAINLSVEQSITTSENTLNSNIANATKDMATQTWTKGQLLVTNDKVSASVQKLHDTVSGEITTATTDMATKSWTQGKLDLTDSSLTSQISSVQDGLTTKFTALQQTLNGVQITANNAVTQTQYTQLSDQFTTTIANVGNGGTNLLYDGGFESGKLNGLPEFYNNSLGNRPLPRGNYAVDLYAMPAKVNDDKEWYWSLPNPIVIKANQYYVISYDYSAAGSATTASDYAVDNAGNIIFGIMMEHTAHDMSDQSVWKRYKKVFRLSTDTTITKLRFGWVANSLSGGWKVIDNVQIEDGSIAHPYSPSQNDLATSSQFTQLQNDINLRVKAGDVVNQINISPESILIAGQKVHITGQTSIDNAVIKDAMIANVTADKITAGTLNAANVNVINLNANNITTGTIKGANLSMNLNTGEVAFQKGSIKSTNGNLNIRIDDGSMSLTNSLGNGAYFKDGNIYMTDSDIWTPGNPKIQYGTLKMVPNFLSDAGGGVALKGPNGVVVGTDEYPDTGILGDLLSSISGGGITLTKEHIRMASEGDIGIAGGKMYNTGFLGEHPAIQVGIAGSHTEPMPWFPSGEIGDALFLSGKVVGVVASNGTGNLMTNTISDLSASCDARSGYVLSAATYKRTYGSGDTVTITPNGVFGRISSASKYKLAIGEISTLNDEAHQFLSVKPKQWFDKSESEALADIMTTGNTDYVDDAKALPHNGFIAEDLYTAGLDSYVIRSNDGSIESIQYDRLPVLHHELIRELFNRLDDAEMEIYKLKQEVLNNAN
ncbi:gp58-like family protein [Latilactobacillus curvatus]|uniref:gp58-like family protein n=1 Tax=Latilactobacillus curvatus TaxID=28038 RepID=UPI0020A4D18A|nr:gp58-like family protein [Latilactobacillus curvatus]UTC12361.1 hypothetical protein A4W75_04485 [Latilactobacillus curvatus]